jgi:hypothetical protein
LIFLVLGFNVQKDFGKENIDHIERKLNTTNEKKLDSAFKKIGSNFAFVCFKQISNTNYNLEEIKVGTHLPLSCNQSLIYHLMRID